MKLSRPIVLLFLLCLTAGPAEAQSSAGFRVEEHSFNGGGAPHQGAVPASASFQVTLVSIGDPTPIGAAAGSSYTVGGGFVVAYPPPGETLNLLLTDTSTLQWDAEPTAGSYNLYRGSTASLPGGGGGDCLEHGIDATSTTDEELPAAGESWFYVVTARNSLGEEGTRGFGRPETGACP